MDLIPPIPFGEYMPDQPYLGNTGATVAKNVIPYEKSYRRMKGLSAFSTALTAYCRGAFTATDTTGSVSSYSGDASKLYRLVGSTMTDSSKVGGYTTSTEQYWEFDKFKNKCIATNFDNPIQAVTLGGSTFADLSATAPKARHIAVIRDFVVVGNTYDAVDLNMPNRVRWSALGDETSWTVSPTTQADYEDLQGNGGWVQGIVGGERGYVFQERAIWLMTYVGSPVVFQFDKIEDRRGLFAPRSFISVGGIVYFLSEDGFYALSGGQAIPVGAGKIDRYFLNDFNSSFAHRVSVASIPNEKIIIWSYPGSGSSTGTPNKLIIYNWAAQKWATAEIEHEMIYSAMSIGLTMDNMDSIYPNLDTIPHNLDSRFFMGGDLNLSAFDTSHRQSYFNGTTLSATIETGEVQVNPGQSSDVNEIIPLIDGGTHTAQVGTRDTQSGTVSWSAISAENSSGICPVRSNSKYHRFRVNITGEFNEAIGVVVRAGASGSR